MNEETSVQEINPLDEIKKKALNNYMLYLKDLRETERQSAEKGLGNRIPQERNPQTGKLFTLVRKIPKISRNESCPCGSKLKFKHCCITK